MQRTLIVAALVVCLAHLEIAQHIIADWQGTLKVGSVELRLVLHIGRESSGAFKATLDSVDQGMNGMAVTSMSLSHLLCRMRHKRHTYSTLRRSVRTEFKVIEELLRHSSLRSTLNVYTYTLTPREHRAQGGCR